MLALEVCHVSSPYDAELQIFYAAIFRILSRKKRMKFWPKIEICSEIEVLANNPNFCRKI